MKSFLKLPSDARFSNKAIIAFMIPIFFEQILIASLTMANTFMIKMLPDSTTTLAAIATNPFELFLDYGNQIRARSFAEQTFLIQLANGASGYLPTKKAEEGGHYSAYVSSGTVGHAGGEQLVRETLTVINRMFSK